MIKVIETLSGIEVHKTENGRYRVYRDGWKHEDCSSEDVIRALGFYLDDRYKRAKKFERAKERIRQLKSVGKLKSENADPDGVIYLYYNGQVLSGILNDNFFFGNYKSVVLTFSQIRKLLTDEEIRNF
jgi:hypothetical protein